MNSLVRVFSNFKDFYNDINAATLTGAIDVIVVEQPDGEFQCSPFHVRFGKLGVLRSREKVVDIEINGAPVDIQMKLGDSGEAFFVEECPDDESDELDENLATSPIPKSYFPNDKAKESALASVHNDKSLEKTISASDDLQIPLPLPRRNSIDFSKDAPKEAEVEGTKFENQVSDYSHRRHTDDTLERRNLSEKLKEYTTQKIRQEWAEHEEIFQFDTVEKEKDCGSSIQVEGQQQPVVAMATLILTPAQHSEVTEPLSSGAAAFGNRNTSIKEIKDADSSLKTKTKKRRKKAQMKKKNSQRKNSSSSSVGSGSNLITNVDINGSGDGLTTTSATSTNIASVGIGGEDADVLSAAISNATNSSSNDESTPKSAEQASAALVTANADDDSPISESCPALPHTSSVQRIHDLDIHFFSDTEITANTSGGSGGAGRGAGRPSTPIQSDSELETTMREKHHVNDDGVNGASWKWGELPTPDKPKSGVHSPDANQAERQSMLSNMFSFMKKANKIRKEATEAGDIYLSDLDAGSMDPKMAALYFPNPKAPKGSTPATVTHSGGDDDRESGNGTSLPHSPSSLEGHKSLDSDFDDGKHQDNKYLDFVAMSLCGMSENGDPSDEEFGRNMISYPDVCKNPSLFSSPNLIVRLNGKYYTWTAACPIVMTIITFQKPLTNDAIAQLTAHPKALRNGKDMNEGEDDNVAGNGGQTKRSWWYWRRSQGNATNNVNGADTKSLKIDAKIDERDGDQTAVATQTSRPDTPDASEQTISKTTDDSTVNAENTSAMVDNMEELSMASNKSDEHKERYKKSLRLSSSAIKKLNLKEGSNLIEFSVTTAYQGTTRCKCYLFRWKHNDKVVISDIDGTITKSDVLGHILPMVGKDWAQLGVAQLFSKIEQNGYKLLYLSARAIGQSRVTREYLRSIRQGNVMLPDGPLLLNPTSLISAFHREVIEKKPEQFKIACLTDIRDLFPNKDPFYAGYGNRINDVWAYRAVGIPIMRIFTINTKGELKHELTQTFQSSYCSMTYIVDQLFPPIRYDDTSVEFSNFNFWRDPIPDVDLEIEEVMASSENPDVNATLTKALRTIPEK